MLPEWARALVPVFLAGQALLAYWCSGAERPPRPPELSQFPSKFGEWMKLREDPIDPEVANTLRADGLLSRTYGDPAGESAGFLVAWFQSQRAGASQPHSPKVCLPASGWTPDSSGEMTIPSAAGAITVNRYVVTSRGERAVVLYWYQTARRATAGEWASKVWLVADALRDRRTDTALVRIVVDSMRGGDQRATWTAANFARSVYPMLRQRLPR
jgi:EpsI family protein